MSNQYPPRAEQFCGNCFYHLEGSCRRYAPRPKKIDANLFAWPRVSPHLWCGDWTPLEAGR
jgi:hypothetical protein